MKRLAALALVGVLAGCEGQVSDWEEEELGELFGHLRGPTKVTVQGALDVTAIDYFDHRPAELAYAIVDEATGTRIPIRAAARSRLEALTSGTRVLATGIYSEGTLAVGEDSEVAVVEEAATVSQTMRRAIVMLVNFTDATVGCSQASVTGLMFTGATNMNDWYHETSFGALGFESDTDGDGAPDVVTVSINRAITGTCDAHTWAADADAAATQAGVNLGLYQHRVYVLPNAGSCSWAGLGSVGCGTYCRAWIGRCNLPDVYAHELAHNLSFRHAQTDGNNDRVADSEYGDRSCIMGYGGVGFRHFNAPHKAQLGWLPASQISASGNGTFRLAPLEVAPEATSELQALRIAKPDSPGVNYYVSFRRKLGSFSGGLRTDYIDRVSIHSFTTGSTPSMLITTLGDGASWTDAVNGISITHSARDEAAATVQVSTACVLNPPQVTFTTRAASQPGATATLSATVSNRDGVGCAETTFQLAAGGPSGWTVSASQGSLSLQPGQSGAIALTATAPAGTGDGSYDVTLTATAGTRQASGSGAYLVDSTPPSPVTNLGGSASKTRVSLSWGVPSDGSGSGAARYHVFRDGAQVATTSATGYGESVQAGYTYQYWVTAEDAAGNVSAPGNVVTLTVRKGGGGGKGR